MILSICNDPDVLSGLRIVKIVITIIKIIVPIILIIFGMLDFVRGVNEGEVSKVLKKFTNRIILAIIILIFPSLVSMLVRIVAINTDYAGCLDNATQENITALYEERAQQDVLYAKNTLITGYYNKAKSEVEKLPPSSLKNDLLTQLKKVDSDIKQANKERAERRKAAQTGPVGIKGGGAYSKSEMMDMDEQTVKDMTNEQFIEFIASLARDVYHEYGGVLPSITIAQACLESGYGNSFEATSHNVYGLMGYPDEKPKVHSLKKFDNFYEATYYHYAYFQAFSGVYNNFLKKCASGDAYGAASYLSAYANGEASYPGKIKDIMQQYNLTKYDN